MKHKKTYIIALSSMLVALSLVIDLISIKTDSTKYTLYALPLLISGIYFGPLVGGLVGLCEGLISQTLTYGLTPTTILWIMAPFTWGLLSGIISKLFKYKLSNFKLSINVLITSFVVLIINTVCLILDGYIYHYPTAFVYTGLLSRITVALIISVVYIYALITLSSSLKKLTSNIKKEVIHDIKITSSNNENIIHIKK